MNRYPVYCPDTFPILLFALFLNVISGFACYSLANSPVTHERLEIAWEFDTADDTEGWGTRPGDAGPLRVTASIGGGASILTSENIIDTGRGYAQINYESAIPLPEGALRWERIEVKYRILSENHPAPIGSPGGNPQAQAYVNEGTHIGVTTTDGVSSKGWQLDGVVFQGGAPEYWNYLNWDLSSLDGDIDSILFNLFNGESLSAKNFEVDYVRLYALANDRPRSSIPLPPDRVAAGLYYNSHKSIAMWAEIDHESPIIYLCFLYPGDFTIHRRVFGETEWGDPLIESTGGNTFYWGDTTVQPGVLYEYAAHIGEWDDDGANYGYLTAGIDVDRTEHKGTMILAVAENIIESNESRLQTLLKDLVGDGWKVDILTTPAFTRSSLVKEGDSDGLHGRGYVKTLRNQIRRIYDGNPEEVKMLYILGHAPIPLSGLSVRHPDGHGARGIYATDHYYADMDGVWSDIQENTDSDSRAPFHVQNVPGDGLFDMNRLPSRTEIAVGRVDPFDVRNDSWFDRNDTHAGRVARFLDKAHKYKNYEPFGLTGAEAYPARLAAQRINLGGQPGATQEATDLVSMFGRDNMLDWVSTPDLPLPLPPLSSTDGDSQFTIDNGPLLYYGRNSGSTEFPDTGSMAVHQYAMQSWWGDWHDYVVARRATMYEDNMTLTFLYTGRWGKEHLFHPLGAGGTFGEAMQLSSNWEFSEYLTKDEPGSVFIMGSEEREFMRALLSDPSLRLFVVPPVRNLEATPVGGAIELSWEAPVEMAEFVEYRVYRAEDLMGDFEEIGNGLTNPSFTDTAAPVGPKIYMVKAIHLTEMGSGSYFNPSQGVFAEVGLAIESTLPPAFPVGVASTFVFNALGGRNPLEWSLSSGHLPAGMELLTDGTLQGTPLIPGNYHATLEVTDGTQTVAREFSLFVDAGFAEVLDLDLRQPGGMGIFDKSQMNHQFSVIGDPQFDPGGEGMVFDGEGDAIRVYNIGHGTLNYPELDYLPTFRSSGATIALAFKAAPGSKGGVIISKSLNLSQNFNENLNQFTIRMLADGRIQASTTQRFITAPGDYRDDEWHSVVYVQIEGTRQVELYINGELAGNSSDNLKTIHEDMLIGARWDGPGESAIVEAFEGSIADIKISPLDYTVGEITAYHERLVRTRAGVAPLTPVISGLPVEVTVYPWEREDREFIFPFLMSDADGEPILPQIQVSDLSAFEHTEAVRTSRGWALKLIHRENFRGVARVTVGVDDGWPGHVDKQEFDFTVAGAVHDRVVSGPEGLWVDVLANDFAKPGSAITLSAVTEQPGSGYARVENGGIRFYPPAIWNEAVTLTYEISISPGAYSDQTQLTISPSNIPQPENDLFEFSGTDPVYLDVLHNDTDPLGERIEIVRVDQPKAADARIVDQMIEFVPPRSGQFEETSFTYYIRNETGFMSSARAIVRNINDSGEAPLVHLKFDEASGNTAINHGSLGDLADGTIHGPITRSDGPTDQALHFDGTSNYVEIPNHPELSFNPAHDSFSIVVGLRLDDPDALRFEDNYAIVTKQVSATTYDADSNVLSGDVQYSLSLGNLPNALWSSTVKLDFNTSLIAASSGDFAFPFHYKPAWWSSLIQHNDVSDWRLLTVIWDAEAQQAEFYIDHWLRAKLNQSGGNFEVGDNGRPILIGAQEEGFGNIGDYLKGDMEFVKIYDRVIVPVEIKANLEEINSASTSIGPQVKRPGGITPNANVTLALNEPVRFKAVYEDIDSDPNDITISWFVNGIPESTGEEIVVTPRRVGVERLSLTCMISQGAGERFNSTRFSNGYTVAESVPPRDDLRFLDDRRDFTVFSETPVDLAVNVTGGSEPITFAISEGRLPDGLALDQVTGHITGTPTQRGLYLFKVEVSDNAGYRISRPLGIRIPGPDSDGDGLLDDWEMQFHGDLSLGPNDEVSGMKAQLGYALGARSDDASSARLLSARATRGPLLEGSDRYWEMEFRRRRELVGMQFIIQSSSDLVNWIELNPNETILSDDGETQRVNLRLPIGDDRNQFYRIRIGVED